MFDVREFRWAVSLIAKDIDRAEALGLFSEGPEIFVRENILPQHPERVVVMSRELNEVIDERQVEAAAEKIVSMINGILYLTDHARDPIKTGTVHRQRSDGLWDTTIVLPAVTFNLGGRLRAHPTLSIPLPPATWLTAGTKDPNVSDILIYMRGDPTWFDLYKAFEEVKADILRQKRGKPAFQNDKSWDEFSRDAQLYRHSRDYCKRKGIIRSDPMSLKDAQALLRSIILEWLKWRFPTN